MITAAEQARTRRGRQQVRPIQLVDCECHYRFGVDPETFEVKSGDFECLHDVEFVVLNSDDRATAAEKVRRFIGLLAKSGFDIQSEE